MPKAKWASDRMLFLEDGRKIGPFSSHWAACAAMIRMTDPTFVSLGGDKPEDLILESSLGTAHRKGNQ